MGKKKFTQDIADILADDLALLESLEPGAVVRPDLPQRPSGGDAASASAPPEPGAPAVAAAPATVEPEPAVDEPALEPAAPGPEPAPDPAAAEPRPEPEPVPAAVPAAHSEPELVPTPEPAATAEPEPPAEPAPTQVPESVVERADPGAGMVAQPGRAIGSNEVPGAPHEVDVPSTPSIPSGQVGNEPARPEAPLTLPPTAPPPSDQQAAALETEPASMEPPDAISAEPMAPAPREDRGGDPPLPFETVQPRSDVSPEPEAARLQPEPTAGPVVDSEPAEVPDVAASELAPAAELEPETERPSAPAPAAEAEAEAPPAPEPGPAPAAVPESAPEAQFQPELEPEAQPGPEAEPEPEATPETEPGTGEAPQPAPEPPQEVAELAGGLAFDAAPEPAADAAPGPSAELAAPAGLVTPEVHEPGGAEPQTPAASAPEPEPVAEVTVLPDVVEEPDADPASAAVIPQGAAAAGGLEDSVTVLEVSPREEGGVSEVRLPGNRASSPPAPLEARRIGWNHPVARWTAYVLVVVALTFVFLWLLVDLFHVG